MPAVKLYFKFTYIIKHANNYKNVLNYTPSLLFFIVNLKLINLRILKMLIPAKSKAPNFASHPY